MQSAPFLPVNNSVPKLMRDVLLALIPGTAVYVALFGPGVLINLLLCIGGCLAFEALSLRLRGLAMRPSLGDFSAVLTGALLALSLPPLAPWWIAVTGAGFAIFLGKQVYGGLGLNPFNPAMVGYVALLISFPLPMSTWPEMGMDLSWASQWQAVFGSAASVAPDQISGATALDHLRTELSLQRTVPEIKGDAVMGKLAGIGTEWVALAYFAGGVFLLWRRRIGWQIPLGLMLGMGLFSTLFWASNPDRFASPMFHLFAGATMLGAFFIATDPVSACTTPRGRLLFGFGVGAITWIIRTWGGYPDGLAFAVLLMNLCAPTIDEYTQPRVYGHGRRPDPP